MLIMDGDKVYDPSYEPIEWKYYKGTALQSSLDKVEKEINEKLRKIADEMGIESTLDLPFCVYLSVIYIHLGLELPRYLTTEKAKYVTYEDGVSRFGKFGD